MLSESPPKFRKRNRPASSDVVVPLPVQTVSVVSVRVIDGAGALWTFSGPVGVTDNVPCPQLRLFVEGQWLGAVNVGTWSTDNQVACDYETGELTDGQAWEVAEPPAGLDFGTRQLALPQSGTTLPPDETQRR